MPTLRWFKSGSVGLKVFLVIAHGLSLNAFGIEEHLSDAVSQVVVRKPNTF